MVVVGLHCGTQRKAKVGKRIDQSSWPLQIVLCDQVILNVVSSVAVISCTQFLDRIRCLTVATWLVSQEGLM